MYSEESIEILTGEQAVDRFDFALKARLATEYPASHPAFIDRLINACRVVNEPVEPAIRRYLVKDSSAPHPSAELLAAFTEEVNQRRE